MQNGDGTRLMYLNEANKSDFQNLLKIWSNYLKLNNRLKNITIILLTPKLDAANLSLADTAVVAVVCA